MTFIKRSNYISLWILLVLIIPFYICNTVSAQKVPSFSLAWSEYPSWSTFGVANELKLIDGTEGKTGPIEDKWGVDIVLKEADYDSCMVMYGAGQCDAVCITNMDVMNPSLTRPSTAILPTSTSYGADACLVSGNISDVKQLKTKKVYGLAKTVSEYCFARNLEILGENEKDYHFVNMDPSAAAVAMQQKREDYDAIVVWNPFVLETLNKRKDVKILFDSTKIPGEIIDMIVVAQSSLDKTGGDLFAFALLDTYYAISKRLDMPETRDDTLVALGEKFSNLNLDSMRTVVKQTKFYGTPDEGLKILTDPRTVEIMNKVQKFCVDHEIVPKAPQIGFGTKTTAANATLRFDASYLQNYLTKKQKDMKKK
jgi:ABC-type nitrate/sulfonate/bicarbonate transport system substrate-binding protein